MNPQTVLQDYFGYSRFREGQEALIRHILSGGDVLGIMPTGAGKSVCYQVPAMLLTGITVVISPLISLMEDQVAALQEAGVPAACLHSNLEQQAYFAVLDKVRAGDIRLLYAAPERLLTDSFLALTESVAIGMVAVDEAHCLSQWGQDFRPGYLTIVEFLERLPRRPVVAAFTATATADVRADIKRLLGLREPLELVTGFDRKNLRWIVERPQKRYDALLSHLRRMKGKSGIVYCISRRATDEVCSKLNADGFSAARYHAGLTPAERTQNQDAFLRDSVQIMVATNAFGMGIDKSNVSFVIHYNMPKSMEAYYQEAGRAGRDGSPAECVLLYSPQDIRTNQFLIESDSGNDRLTEEQRRTVKQKDYERLSAMVRYCSLTDCLRHEILRYFGESAPTHCGNCSSCLADTDVIDATVAAQKILSCVYRIAQRGLNCGTRLLCDVLRGKDSKQIAALNLSTVSTYGLLGDLPQKQLEQMVGILISRGYLSVNTAEYSSLALTAKAAPVLRGAEQVMMSLPHRTLTEAARERKLAEMPEFAVDEDLFQRLRRLRERFAAREYKPAYVIFSDATLRALCAHRPRNSEEMLAVPGIGKYKLEKYGDAFLRAIAEYEQEARAPRKTPGETH
ncbi:MAG: DNA helicase RecQ [Oscillospiraceae bacterium]|nr:DNA helicase RecQ [Oscillospiraceae bacterium]